MPIWGEVELLCRAIIDEARQHADEIVSHAREEAETWISKSRSQAEKECREHERSRRKAASLEAKRIVDSAEFQARKKTVTFREQMMRQILAALRNRFEEMGERPDYAEFLMAAVREGVTILSTHAVVVELRPRDLDALKGRLEAVGEELSVELELRSNAGVEGGVRILTPDHGRLLDRTLNTLLERRTDEIQSAVWRTVLGHE